MADAEPTFDTPELLFILAELAEADEAKKQAEIQRAALAMAAEARTLLMVERDDYVDEAVVRPYGYGTIYQPRRTNSAEKSQRNGQ